MHAVGGIDLEASAPAVLAGNDLVHVGRTETLAGTSELLRTTLLADPGVGNPQVRGLVLLVSGSGKIDVGELVEGGLPVCLQRARGNRAGAMVGGNGLHPLVAGPTAQRVFPAPPAGHHLEPRMEQALHQAVLEPLMKVAHPVEFPTGPTVAKEQGVPAQRPFRKVVLEQGLKNGFGRQHARLHGQVNTLEPHRIHQSRRIADEQPAVEIAPWHGVVTAFRQRLGPVAGQLGSRQPGGDQRMGLEALEPPVRVQIRVLVVQSHHQTQ